MPKELGNFKRRPSKRERIKNQPELTVSDEAIERLCETLHRESEKFNNALDISPLSFELSAKQLAKVQDWLVNEVYPPIIKRQRNDPSCDPWLPPDAKEPYMGAIGGGVTYSFTPTSIGMAVNATFGKGTKNEQSLDLTDYDEW